MATTQSTYFNLTPESTNFKESLQGHHESSFDDLHYTGIAFISISLFCSISIIVYLNFYGFSAKSGFDSRFSNWPLSERLFTHHAITNILFGCCHLLDLMRIIAMQTQMPMETCRGFGVALHAVLLSDCAIAVFAAVNSISLVHTQKELSKCDKKLALCVYIIPIVTGVILAFVKIMGPSVVW